ncbi:MAG: anion permease, partial [Rhizobiaceae bacterium]|nr:anion permease [Rhizobiaceae bacterium]
RFRIEVISIAGLLAGYLLGLYPAESVFSGFASPIVITVVEILLIVQVLARAQLFGMLGDRLIAADPPPFIVIAALSGLTMFISIFMNNIGAYAIALPVALRIADVTAIPRRQLLIPISFAALLGGLVSLIGTPANLLVSDALFRASGQGFHFFDFAYVGLPVAIIGVLLIAATVLRLFPQADDMDVAAPPERIAGRRMIAERRVPHGSPMVGQRLADCQAAFGIKPHALIRNSRFVFGSIEATAIDAGDIVLAEGLDVIFDELSAKGVLVLESHRDIYASDVIRSEAVVMPESTLIGSRIQSLEVFRSRGVAITGLSARSPRIEGRFDDLAISIGDILRLEGPKHAIAEALEECECLPLAAAHDHAPPLRSYWPLVIFACGVLTVAFGLLRPEIAFAGVILAMALLNHINLRSAIADLNWPIIIMLAAMIPLGAAVATTGLAEMLADGLGALVPVDRPLFGVALTLFLGMAITPFVNNATVAIVLSPIGLALAARAGQSANAYLIAVAAGASLDFLTPFGHHNNTLTMSIGSYRFADFLRAGWLLSIVSYVLALVLIDWFWI